MGKCEVCGKIGRTEMKFGVTYCPDCLKAWNDQDKDYFDRIGMDNASERTKREIQELINRTDHPSTIIKNKKSMIVSSCQSIDGYRAVEQYGIVFGECVFKSGFFKRLSASIDNFADFVSFGDQEMSGSTGLMDDARNYAMNKLITNAAAKGANAIIGLDAESSIGGELIHVMIYGTAVRIEPIE